MKKQLLTTTALVAAGALVLSGGAVADKMKKPSLKISGQLEQFIGLQSPHMGDDKVVHLGDGEIHFTASMKLDNGITVSGRTEFEADVANQGKIDESFMDVTGSFGKIRLGATDGAMYEMVYGYLGHPATAAGLLNLAFQSGLSGTKLTGRGVPTLSSDHDALVYFTPRISGLQAGVSYVQEAGELEDIVTSAVNYVGKFGDAGVGAALGYGVGDGTSNDTTVITGGIKVTMGGFTGAVGFVRNSNDSGAADEDYTRADAGLRYTFGPNAVRVGYLMHSDDHETDKTASIATFARTLGPGVTWSLDALMTEDKHNDSSGSFIGTGIQIKF